MTPDFGDLVLRTENPTQASPGHSVDLRHAVDDERLRVKSPHRRRPVSLTLRTAIDFVGVNPTADFVRHRCDRLEEVQPIGGAGRVVGV